MKILDAVGFITKALALLLKIYLQEISPPWRRRLTDFKNTGTESWVNRVEGCKTKKEISF